MEKTVEVDYVCMARGITEISYSFMKGVEETLGYFAFFKYPPTLGEIHTFLKKRSSKRRLTSILENMKRKSVVKSQSDNRYTLGEYSIEYGKRHSISQKKLQNSWFRLYVRLLASFPQIKLVGLSGSVAMMNAEEEHDIDLFIITAKNRLFTGRFIALALAQILGLRRKRDPTVVSSHEYKNKVCLNLFFDEQDLKVPEFKQTEYVAHEILQMKPLVQKGSIYMRFIDANKWVFDIFPNAKFKVQSSNVKLNSRFKVQKFWISNEAESILKRLQLSFINRHRTIEIITPTQLWFFPDDFEKRLFS